MSMNNRHTAICVLGMHRSGTSAVTRGLNLLGAYLGEEKILMPPLPENPEGFWERMDIYYLQERILSFLDSEWATSNPLPANWHKTNEIRPFRDELASLIKDNFSSQPVWLWKDPRTCLLLPLWKDVLSELEIGLKILFVIRNPLDVAKSLARRNGFTIGKALGIWLNYTSSALKSCEGCDITFLSFDSFLDDWYTELKKSALVLGLEWPVDDIKLKEQMASFVRHDLRHSATKMEDLQALDVPEPVIRLYQFVLDLQAGKRSLNADGYS